ncbi:MAG: Omp28-related outer membrane protein [Crocinitomicaceae bacterium]|nr:Omp28-related outer membrane protein [Crocinitomicaceae bacterium]
MKKKILLMGGLLLINTSLFSQVFTDNFDSYTAGDYLVSSNPTAWRTWTGGAGGSTEDTKISSAQAASAPNSIYFSSTAANGGPADIILKFDEVYTSGNFTLESNFFVESGKGAYFNLQQDHTPGNIWALDCYMNNAGVIKFKGNNNSVLLLQGTYPTNTWFNLKLSINLTSNQWEVFIDNTSIGTFSNPITSIGIWDLYPVNPTSEGGNNQSGFYVDDVSYSHVPPTLYPKNAGVSYVEQIDGLVGQSGNVIAKVRNLGSNPITSFDVKYTYNGNTITETVSSVNIASLAFYQHTFTTPLTLVSGNLPLTVTVSNVNGAGADDDASDDSKTVNINPVVPTAGKIVVGEEGTGTWCGWCPRGAVFMDMMANKYDGFWAGIAVHNADPMADAVYDAGMATKVSGYPSALVDRGTTIDPSAMEDDFITRVKQPIKATVVNGASFDSSTRELKVSLTFNFNATIPTTWKVACVLTEDGVTGTGSGYNQSNYYAGGGSGVMGGYESLPSSVPAAQMVYNHVARKIEPSFAGGSLLQSGITAGSQQTVCFTFTLPSTWDESKMHIVGMLIEANGKINNAGYSTISDAVANGLASCTTASVAEITAEEAGFVIYPNPTNGMAFIDIVNLSNENVTLTITDLSGKVIAERNYELNGTVSLPINTTNFNAGTYFVTLQRNGSIQQQKLIVR